MMFSVKAELFKNAHNYATPDESYIESFYKLKEVILEDKKKIHTLVIQIDNHSFSDSRSQKYDNGYYWRDYLDYIDIAHKTSSLVPIGEQLKAEFIPYFNNKNNFYNYFRNKRLFDEEITKGFYPAKNNFNEVVDPLKTASIRADNFFEGYEVKSIILTNYLSDLVNLAKVNNINVVLVSLPISEPYIAAAAKYIPMDEFEKLVNEVLDENNLEDNYLDYSEIYKDDLTLFSDSDHLNVTGADKFTKLLVKDLANL
jgi:hypothetical protein